MNQDRSDPSQQQGVEVGAAPRRPLRSSGRGVAVTLVALATLVGACGPESGIRTGQAVTDPPGAATISLNDSSAPTLNRSATTRADGSFDLSVAGLTTPFLLQLEWSDAGLTHRRYAVSEEHDDLDVNDLTDLAFCGGSTAGESAAVFEHSGPEGARAAATRARLLLGELSSVLVPLFSRYGIADPRTSRDAVRVLLRDVQVARLAGIVTITNRATGGVIFVGPISDLAAGVFSAGDMPPGPNAPPPTTCTAFTYSAFGACQADGTQTRTVLTSSPGGCTGGTPVTAQACVFVPPVKTCTAFTYSAFGTCQADGTQTRTVLTSSPTGCTGGAPVTEQACSFVPPLDGAALYTRFCSGCHRNRKKHRSVAAIQNAIDANTGGMGALKVLTAAQIAAISAAP